MNSQSFNNVPSAFGKGLPSLFRMRLKFSRLGQARNLSHLEQIRELRRMVKASKLPYAVARCGKIQIPRMSFGPAISVGYESLAEYADLYLSRSENLREMFDSLQAVSEKGISVLSVKKIPLHFPSIEALVNVAEYEISGEAIQNCNDETIKRFLERNEIAVAKNKPGGRSYLIDAKPLIISMKLKNSSMTSGEGPVTARDCCADCPVPDKSADAVLHLMLRFGPKRNIKPEGIIELLMKEHTSTRNVPMFTAHLKGTVPVFFEKGGQSQGMSQRFYSSALQVARKELYWENSSGQLITP